MLTTLREGFVNSWLLAKDFEAIAAAGGDMATLVLRLRENYGYPVDSVLLAPDLRVLGHVNVRDVMRAPDRYLAFLQQGLVAAGRPGVAVEVPAKAEAKGAEEMSLTPQRPSGQLLEVVRCRGFGVASFAYYPIDTTAFSEGGVLEFELRVGGSSLGLTFELCAPVDLPADESVGGARQRAMRPVQTIEVAAEGKGTLVYTFAQGVQCGLAVKPSDLSREGQANAFLATVTVRRP